MNARLLTVSLALGLSSVAFAGVSTTLDVDGECPGRVDMDISGAPGATFVVIAGDSAGSTVIPSGACAGTDLGIVADVGVLSKFPVTDFDGDGMISMRPRLRDGMCGKLFVAIDMSTCDVSDIFSFGMDPVTFTNCGTTGATGPDQAACDAEYAGTDLEGMVTVSAGIQSWTTPRAGTYRITAVGAKGRSGDEPADEGGNGAEIIGEFDLPGGMNLNIAVGQRGLNDGCNAGGGGGSWVVDDDDNPLIVAGGGGGTRSSVDHDGCDAQTGTFAGTGSSSSASWDCGPKVSDEGFGGIVSGSSWGSAGGGYLSDGAGDASGGGFSWFSGLNGGSDGGDATGGFGGAGSGEGGCGGGGGGGYSGGDGGRLAGGGGSFNAGDNPSATAGVGTDEGWIIIEGI